MYIHCKFTKKNNITCNPNFRRWCLNMYASEVEPLSTSIT